MQKNNTGLRQAELIMTFSLATDLGIGRPIESALSSALLAVRFGELLNLSELELWEAYHVALLRYIGCTADMGTSIMLFGDDPAAAGTAYRRINSTKPQEMLGWMLRYMAPEQPPLQRMGTFFNVEKSLTENTLGHCEVAEHLAAQLGYSKGIQNSIWQAYERWDGSGFPNHIKGEALTLPIRVVHLIHDVDALRREVGQEAALAIVRQRAGSLYDPQLTTRFCAVADHLLAGLESDLSWETVVAAEPGTQTYLSNEEFDNAAQVFAHFIDIGSPIAVDHSRRVAELAATAAQHFGMSATETKAIERMGWLHDLGKIAVPQGIFFKPRALTNGEWERIRLHPYYTERILAHSPVLAQLGSTASCHHERLDGSGYHRSLKGDSLTPAARILAAANFYQARVEPRVYRQASTPEIAADDLRNEVRSGRLDSDAVQAVLMAAGHRTTPVRRERVAGLSEREIEVLRLITRGLSNKQMAQQLSLSEKTVSNHIMHIYEKINVSTRAAATLFAMQHQLIENH